MTSQRWFDRDDYRIGASGGEGTVPRGMEAGVNHVI